ncbi:Fur family transcriptional regulator [Pontibacter roseus]|uniref:Fur family transcriptional regulator n=1 Tax=Pontibacter roseus TaxID=336989 RepID=UPI00037E7F52|nr:transcriptional repressor [Pontibacter roseus]
MNKLHQIIHKYGLRKTNCRTDVLNLFLENKHALAHAAIEQQLGKQYDRVTLYRTLHSFEEKGLLHSINDGSGAVKYALCKEACNQHQHHDNHIHFSCTSCGQTYCINEVHIPALRMPAGYQVRELHFSAQGICSSCSKAQK